ncbi:ribonuclease H [Senna tora]|uniref:Ribonuclease H n=1 Tax=Senna tora TaxID=362788 RepID=A0A834X167_9FABA|nr:ribonuclease H [Senna tora]
MLPVKSVAVTLNSLGYDNYVGTNVEGRSGGTILAWNQATQCTVIDISKHWIHASAISATSGEFQFTCVYGHPRLAERAILWEYLQQKASVTDVPWIVFGDFNQVSSSVEKLSSCSSIPGADQFKNLLDEGAMIDLHAQGNWYTWHNGRLGDAAVWERLDKTLCNIAWIENFPQTKIFSLPSFCSDHSPLVLNMHHCIPYRPRPFRFEAMWLLDESCEKVVRDAWLVNKRGSLAYSFVQKCKGVKQDLRTWNQKEIRKSLEDKLAKEELLWAQKARQLWRGYIWRLHLQMLRLKMPFFLMKPDKAPGPDGLPTMFFQRFWPVVKNDLIACIKSFFDRGFILKELNQTMITLIPKNQSPEQFKDFRPISLCNVVVKIISKVLVIRMQSIMERIIAPNQNGFVKGRAISDSILLASELMTFIHKARRVKTNWCAFKLDIHKAYDKLSWDFLHAVMIRMAFPHKIIQVIMQCVTTVSYSLMLNGQQAGNFQPQRGIRQGDPLSPYLFLLCSNILSCMLHKEELMNKLQGIQFGRRGPRISHLMYADDTILFFKADPQNCSSVKKTLDTYARLAGQVLNKDKSIVIFSPNTPRQFKRIMSATLGAKTSNKLGKYLGVNVDNKVNSVELYKELVEKLESKLAGWKSRLLSQSGRLTLIQSVLQSSPIYQLSVMHMPNKYADKIDALSTNFYWGHNSNKAPIHLASRKKIFRSKDKGGLGLRQTSLFNKALLAKQVWRIVSQPTSIYSKWACAKYFKCNLESPPKKTTQPSAIWKCIDKSGKLIFDNLWWSVGSGAQIPLGSKFWWPLQATLPQHSQQHTVANLVDTNTRAWNHQLVNQLFAPHIARDILQIPLSVSDFDDRLSWKFSTSGEYKVSEGYHFLSDAGRQNNPSDFFPWKFLWSLSIPSRVKNFVWRILNDALPNLTNLKRHHMPVEEICYLCQQESESLDHIFITCPFARAIWFGSSLALHIEDFYSLNLIQCLSHWFLQAQQGTQQDLQDLQTKLICLHNIWQARNKFYMEGQQPSPLNTIQVTMDGLSSLNSLLLWKLRKGPRKYLILAHQQLSSIKSIALGYASINTIVFESRGHHQIITKNQSSGHAILQKDILLFIKQRNIRTTVMAIADRDAYKSYVTSLIPQNIFLFPTNSFIHL